MTADDRAVPQPAPPVDPRRVGRRLAWKIPTVMAVTGAMIGGTVGGSLGAVAGLSDRVRTGPVRAARTGVLIGGLTGLAVGAATGAWATFLVLIKLMADEIQARRNASVAGSGDGATQPARGALARNGSEP